MMQHGSQVVDVLLILRLVCTQGIELSKQAVNLSSQALVDTVCSVQCRLQILQPGDV